MLAIFLGTDGGIDAFYAENLPLHFDAMRLIYEYNFDVEGKHNQPAQWGIGQHTNWNVKNGILTGGLADVTYRKRMRAKKDWHDGTRPVIFLKPVPQVFVVQMPVRYNETAKRGRDRGSLLDRGHHVNSFIFPEGGGVLPYKSKRGSHFRNFLSP